MAVQVSASTHTRTRVHAHTHALEYTYSALMFDKNVTTFNIGRGKRRNLCNVLPFYPYNVSFFCITALEYGLKIPFPETKTGMVFCTTMYRFAYLILVSGGNDCTNFNIAVIGNDSVPGNLIIPNGYYA